MLYFLRRNTLALALGALCVKSMRDDKFGEFRRRQNRPNGRLSPPRPDRSDSRSSLSAFSDDTSDMSLSGSPKRMVPRNRFKFINVSDLYYTHAQVKISDGVMEGTVSLQFQSGKTSDGKHRVTIYDTIFALLFGDADQGVDQGIIQRLVVGRKTPLTRLNVGQQELQDALAATLNEFSWGPDFIPDVVGKQLSDNNRTLYVLQTIKKVFPYTEMMVPYKAVDELTFPHKRSSICDCDHMTVQVPHDYKFRLNQGGERADLIMDIFKQDHKLHEEKFLSHVKGRMAKLISVDAMDIFFEEQVRSASRFGSRKKSRNDAW